MANNDPCMKCIQTGGHPDDGFLDVDYSHRSHTRKGDQRQTGGLIDDATGALGGAYDAVAGAADWAAGSTDEAVGRATEDIMEGDWAGAGDNLTGGFLSGSNNNNTQSDTTTTQTPTGEQTDRRNRTGVTNTPDTTDTTNQNNSSNNTNNNQNNNPVPTKLVGGALAGAAALYFMASGDGGSDSRPTPQRGSGVRDRNVPGSNNNNR